MSRFPVERNITGNSKCWYTLANVKKKNKTQNQGQSTLLVNKMLSEKGIF